MVRVVTMITVSQVIFRRLWVGFRKFVEALSVLAILLVQWFLNS